MRTFRDTFETCKGSIISAFSICITVPLRLKQQFKIQDSVNVSLFISNLKGMPENRDPETLVRPQRNPRKTGKPGPQRDARKTGKPGPQWDPSGTLEKPENRYYSGTPAGPQKKRKIGTLARPQKNQKTGTLVGPQKNWKTGTQLFLLIICNMKINRYMNFK